MGSTNFKQYDSRWAGNPYAGDSMNGSGCGPTAIADIVYAKDTSINPWKVACWLTNNGYASDGSGTYWSGMKAALEAYGFVAFWRDTMIEAMNDWAKGNYWGIILMNPGTKGGVTWTTGGHFICVRDYKYENGKNWFLIGDPGWRDNDGWYCYEDHLKGLCNQVWTCYLPGWSPTTHPTAEKLAEDDWWGPKVTKRAQQWLGTYDDSKVSNQLTSLKKWLPNCSTASWEFNNKKGGSDLIRALQRKVNADVDGTAGHDTIYCLQVFLKNLGYYNGNLDGICGRQTVNGFIRFLNSL